MLACWKVLNALSSFVAYFSVDDLSRICKLSRITVYKHLGVLKSEGFVIVSSSNYMLDLSQTGMLYYKLSWDSYFLKKNPQLNVSVGEKLDNRRDVAFATCTPFTQAEELLSVFKLSRDLKLTFKEVELHCSSDKLFNLRLELLKTKR